MAVKAEASQPRGRGFNPCRGLSGNNVSIELKMVAAKTYLKKCFYFIFTFF